MFDHVRDETQARRGVNTTALLAAVALMLAVIGGVSVASVWLLARVGLDIRPTVVEVTFDPMGDGRTLEDLQAEERARQEAAAEASAADPAASADEVPQDR